MGTGFLMNHRVITSFGIWTLASRLGLCGKWVGSMGFPPVTKASLFDNALSEPILAP